MAAHEIAKEFVPIGTGPTSLEDYRELHAESIANPSAFWLDQATKRLEWFVPPTVGLQGDFQAGDVRWFAGGKLNVSYNCLDRMAAVHPDKCAIVFEGDEPDDIRKLSYQETLRRTCQIANALIEQGVKRGDVVTIYMPMVPELAMTMLACARIGAVHSVVFAGFSAEALAQRMSAARSAFLVTADVGKRGGKTIPLKEIVDSARTKLDVEDSLKTVFCWERFYQADSESATYELKPKDVRMDVAIAKQRPYCVPEWMDAEGTCVRTFVSERESGDGIHMSVCIYMYVSHVCCGCVFSMLVLCSLGRYSDTNMVAGMKLLVPYRQSLYSVYQRQYGQTQGPGAYNGWLCSLCGLYDPKFFCLARWRFVCLCGRLWMDYRTFLRCVRSALEWDHDLHV